MRRYLAIISYIVISLVAQKVNAQALQYPENDGDRLECNALIEFPKGYVSGICVLEHDGDIIRGAIVNEFGITALNFSYYLDKDKVKLNDVIAMLDKWYVKKVLRKDIKSIILGLKDGRTTFTNGKFHIKYSLSPMNEEKRRIEEDDNIEQ